MFEWLIFSLGFMAIWIAVFAAKPLLRKEMFWVSLFTMFTGFIEPVFVPRYWNPPSLFNLAATTGFDVESLIFAFATGGIASVLYEVVLRTKHRKIGIDANVKFKERRWFHFFSLAVVPVLLFLLIGFTSINPIYSAAISLTIGAVAAVICRPDLTKNTIVGGVLFMALYFVFFLFINMVFPSFVYSWNLSALSGIIVIGVPIEELMFSFAFGMMWSGVYEHAKHYALSESRKQL